MTQPSPEDDLPPGPWKVCGADRGVCKCGQIWSADDTHIATAHHVSQAQPHDLEAQEVYPSSLDVQKAVARAIAAIPEMRAENERLQTAWHDAECGRDKYRAENESLRAENAKLRRDDAKG